MGRGGRSNPHSKILTDRRPIDVTPLSQARGMTNQLHLFSPMDYEVPQAAAPSDGIWGSDRADLDDLDETTRQLGLRRVQEARAVLRVVAFEGSSSLNLPGRNRPERSAVSASARQVA